MKGKDSTYSRQKVFHSSSMRLNAKSALQTLPDASRDLKSSSSSTCTRSSSGKIDEGFCNFAFEV